MLYETGTLRAHDGRVVGPAYESSFVNVGYGAVSCDGAGTTTNPELFVASRALTGTSTALYWNILPND